MSACSSATRFICGCEETPAQPLKTVTTLSSASYVDLRTLNDDPHTWDLSTDNVSSVIARIGSVLEVGGEANDVAHDPYGQCHTVRLVLSPTAKDVDGYGERLNQALLSCRLPYVERFDVDLSGYTHAMDIKLESFLRMYDSTIREVRVGCGPARQNWGAVNTGFIRILNSAKSLACLERFTLVLISASPGATALLSMFELNILPDLTNLVNLNLHVDSFGKEGIKLSAPALRSLVLREIFVVPDEGPISLVSVDRLVKICISSARKVILSDTNQHLQYLELYGATRLSGDVSNVKVASLSWCPANIAARVLSSTTSHGHSPLRQLALHNMVAPKQIINAEQLDVLLLSNVTILEIVVEQHTLAALYLHEVRILTECTISGKNVLLSGCEQTIDSYIATGGIQGTHLESLAIHYVRENDFAGECVSPAMTEFLHSIKDSLVRFACFSHVPWGPVMPQLRFLATTTVPDIRYLQGQLGEKQLNEFACPKSELPTAKANSEIRFLSKSQVPCDSIAQYWYANLGFETPLVYLANKCWSFLLSNDIRKILRKDYGFVVRPSKSR